MQRPRLPVRPLVSYPPTCRLPLLLRPQAGLHVRLLQGPRRLQQRRYAAGAVDDACLALFTLVHLLSSLTKTSWPLPSAQFIVLTNDDAITVISQPIILNITERHQNKNGCKMPAT